MDISIGRIIKPQGILGEVKVKPFCDISAVWSYIIGKKINVDNSLMKVRACKYRQGFYYIFFDGVNNRNDAELLRAKSLMLRKDIIDSLKGDTLIYEDLIGLEVYDENGYFVGQIMDIENYGACDIFVMQQDGKKIQVPFVTSIFKMKDGRLYAFRKEFDGAKTDY